MGQRWIIESRLTWDIELIQLDKSRVFRVRRGNILVGYCRTVVELEQLLAQHGLTTADMIEVTDND